MVAQDSPVYIYHSGLISSATGSVGSQKCLGLDVKLYITQTLLSTPTAAKSLQSCPTLCDPIDGSPPGSAVPEILQARTLEWVAISFSNAWNWKVKVKSLSRVQLLATPWTTAYQAPPSMGFSRQEYWSGGPLPSPLSTPNPLLIISRAQHFLSISTNSLLANAILPLVSSLINSQFLTRNPLLAPDQAVTITIKLNLTVLSMMGLTLRDLFPAHFQTLSLPFCSPSGGPLFFVPICMQVCCSHEASQVTLMVKNLPTSAGDMSRAFDPWLVKIPWKRAWQSTPVFLPGESHGQRSLAGYCPWGHRVGHTWGDLAWQSTCYSLCRNSLHPYPQLAIPCALEH